MITDENSQQLVEAKKTIISWNQQYKLSLFNDIEAQRQEKTYKSYIRKKPTLSLYNWSVDFL